MGAERMGDMSMTATGSSRHLQQGRTGISSAGRNYGQDPDIQPLECVLDAESLAYPLQKRIEALNYAGIYLVGDCEHYHRHEVACLRNVGAETLAALDAALEVYGAWWGSRCGDPEIDLQSGPFWVHCRRLGILQAVQRIEEKTRAKHAADEKQRRREHAAAVAAFPARLQAWRASVAQARADNQSPVIHAPVDPGHYKPRGLPMEPIIAATLVARAQARRPWCYEPRPRPVRLEVAR